MESKQAVHLLLPAWVDIDVDDALELLGPSFSHPSVRQYAVRQLHKASDEDLSTYLLQLVQAIKFENINFKSTWGQGVPLKSTGAQENQKKNWPKWYLWVVPLSTTLYAQEI